MGAADDLGFTRQILAWYWKHGCQRTGKYALPKESWLDRLTGLQKRCEARVRLAGSRRPLLAVCASSPETSALAVAARSMEATTPGSAAHPALAWSDSASQFRLRPVSTENGQAEAGVFDGAVIGLAGPMPAAPVRLVAGSLDPASDAFHVRDPDHPVVLRLLDPRDLTGVLARGYDAVCRAAPALNGSTQDRPEGRWTPAAFLAVVQQHATAPARTRAKPSREAYEILHDTCDLLESLIKERRPRFSGLGTGEADWPALRRAVLAERVPGMDKPSALHLDAARADVLAQALLWDGHSILGESNMSLFEALGRLRQQGWADKPVCCDIESASWLRDARAYLAILRPLPGRPSPTELGIHRGLGALAWEDRGDHIVVDATGRLANRLVDSPESFGLLQALIAEITLPVDTRQVAEAGFAALLKRADLIDLPADEPAVGQEDRIDVGRMARIQIGERPTDGFFGERDEPHQLLLRIFRCGKLASTRCEKVDRPTSIAVRLTSAADASTPPDERCTVASIESAGLQETLAALTDRIDGTPPLEQTLARIEAANAATLAAVMQHSGLCPFPPNYDPRRDHLVQFRERLEAACNGADEAALQRLNAALRRALDVDPSELDAVPGEPAAVDAAFLRAQLQRWLDARAGASSELAAIGFDEADAFRHALAAMIESVEPELDRAAADLRSMVERAGPQPPPGNNLRRPLALLLANLLIHGRNGHCVRSPDAVAGPASDKARASRHYRDFIEPFSGEKGHLAHLIAQPIPAPVRPDQPGDAELLSITSTAHPELAPA